MKPLAFAALLAPFVLFAVVLGSALATAHREAAKSARPTVSQSTPPAPTITTLPAVTVSVDASRTAAAQNERAAVTRWLATLKATAAPHDAMSMPYYSIAKPIAAITNKG